MTELADFSGWATKTDLVCSDGRTILQDAFAENDGVIVPLVYGHDHNDNLQVLGHAKLENVSGGVRAHAFFNLTAKGQAAKEQVRHGDLKWLSVYANQLIERGKQVVKGNIRELSLVLAGANPGAVIDHVALEHYDGENIMDGEAFITTGLDVEIPEPVQELAHADAAVDDEKATGDKTLQEILDTLNPEQETAVNYLLSKAITASADGSVQHSGTEDGVVEVDVVVTEGEGSEGEGSEGESSEDEGSEGESTEGEGSEGEGSEDAGTEGDGTNDTSTDEAGDAVQHDTTTQEDNSMTHNVFDQAKKGQMTGDATTPQATLAHDGLTADAALEAIKDEVLHGSGSLKRALMKHAREDGITVGGELKHGIENIDYLFPDAKTLSNSPAFITRRMEWVDKVLGAVRKQPMARIKTVTADITPDEARARGYITGNLKNEEYFELAKRITTPQTVYKKQKLDRDDVVDITELDVVAWLKAEMKVMLDEEIASAILFGDGRSSGDEDKISETNIRSIANDAELYVTKVNVNIDDANSSIEELVDAVIANREYYKGSGMPTFYTTEAVIGKFLTVKDTQGHRLYKSVDEIATTLRVADVVAVETMVRVPDLVGIMVNLSDYSIGTDRMGQATMFDDFDLDYNKLRYLLETRLSGALTTPKAALVFRKVAGSLVVVLPDVPAFVADTGVVTIPTKTGVVYKNADTDATLSAGAQTALAEGASVKVKAVPAAGYYFADDQHDEWTFTRDEA